MRVLVTGAGGFVGSHLVEALLRRGDVEVWGTYNPNGQAETYNDQVAGVRIDLCDPDAVETMLGSVRPDYVYHLAGQAFVPASWTDPWETLSTNIRSQLNVLQGCIRTGLTTTRSLVIGSQEEYGTLVDADLPATEQTNLRPDNPYGVSKVAQDLLGHSYFIRYGLPVVRVRPFNHIGPRQNSRFVASDFARQIAAIEAGRQAPTLRVGNLQSERDFTDVRDVVRAYIAALEKGAAGDVYVVASGLARPVKAILDGLIDQARCSVAIEVDPTKYRAADALKQRGDSSKLRAVTGWSPMIPLEQTLRDILDYERQLL